MLRLGQTLFPGHTADEQKLFLILALILIVGITVVALLAPWQYVLGTIAVVLILLFFFRFITLGLYLMVLFYPFIYLQLFVGRDINIPYVDLLAMVVFFSWAVRSIFFPPYGGIHFIKNLGKGTKFSFENFPGFIFFLLFLAASLLSLINAENTLYSLKYIFRPLTFFYLMFVVLPYNVINSKKVLLNVLRIFYGVGIFVALMGLWSILFSENSGLLRRALPLPIFGVPILGTNHNLIAEVLISVIPIGFILIWETKEIWLKKLLITGVLLMAAINLLTFSRTGWIALAFELLALVLIKYRKNIRSYFEFGLVVMLIISPLLVYGYFFLTSEIVRSSNMNRIALTKIALETFIKHPVVGAGAGTFVEQVAMNRWYIVDFGSPSEAHGVAQKLLAETGALGFLTFFVLLSYIILRLVRTYRETADKSPYKYILLALILTSAGSIIFQLFNTSYFVSKMWLPLGVALAAARLAEEEKSVVKKT
ncbi:MAG: O-antigen ligase family protein [Patescibacteria group bacterium]|jgi:O-antigen ligase